MILYEAAGSCGSSQCDVSEEQHEGLTGGEAAWIEAEASLGKRCVKTRYIFGKESAPFTPQEEDWNSATRKVLFACVIPTTSARTMAQVPIELYEHTPAHTTAVVTGTWQHVCSSKQSLKNLKIIQHFFSCCGTLTLQVFIIATAGVLVA